MRPSLPLSGGSVVPPHLKTATDALQALGSSLLTECRELCPVEVWAWLDFPAELSEASHGGLHCVRGFRGPFPPLAASMGFRVLIVELLGDHEKTQATVPLSQSACWASLINRDW